ncbi:hypothetical protein ScPMuIL_009474 [Solemya velum]
MRYSAHGEHKISLFVSVRVALRYVHISRRQMTPCTFQLSDIYPPITITPKRLSFTSPSTTAPKICDGSDVVKRPFSLDVAFLVGETTTENFPPTEGKASNSPVTEDNKVPSPTTINGSRTWSPESIPASSGDSGDKNTRTKYTPQQLNTLEKVFVENPYPDTDEVERLAGEIGVTEGKIRIWFQNKRARWRRRAQNTTQQQTFVPSTSGYPVMPTSNYGTIPPYVSTCMPTSTYPTVPFLPYPPVSSAHDRLSNPTMSTPTYPPYIGLHHFNGETPTAGNSTTHSSPSSSPGSTSCGTIRSLSRNQSSPSGYPPQSLLRSSEEAKKHSSSSSSTSIAHPIPRQFMTSLYNPLPQYSSYYPHMYSQFPLYY